jgi:putative spermidine/putrescine transport system permease protein
VTKKNHFLSIFLLLMPGAGYIAVLLAAALGMTVMQSLGLFNLTGQDKFGLQEWQKVLNQQTWDSFYYSAKVALFSSFGALAISYPLALFLRRNFLGKSVFNALFRVPLFTPALVAAFLILNVVSYHGIFNELLVALKLIKEPLRLTHDDWGIGVVAIQIWKNLPFQAMILTSVLASIQVDLENAARNLGANQFEVFKEILFPLSIPGVLTGVILVFIGVFGDYAINTVAGPQYPPSLSANMYVNARNFGYWGQAACMAIIIMAASLIFAWLFSQLAKIITGGKA